MGNWQEDGTTLILGESVTGLPQYFLGRFSASYTDNNIRHVDFSNATNLTSIGQYSFRYCYNLQELTLPESLTSVSTYAFEYCQGLKTCSIPSSLSTIPSYAFNYCTKLEEVILSEGVSTIQTYAFSHCSSLKDINFVESLKTIDTKAFEYCSRLQEAVFPGPVSLKNYVFQYCDRLHKVRLLDANASLGQYCFLHCHNLKELELPDGLTTVPAYCFQYCYALSSLNLKNVTTISTSAFQGCYGLQELDLKNVSYVGTSSFDSCHNIRTVTLNSSLTTIDSYAFRYCYKLYEVNNYSTLSLTAGATSNGYVAYYAKQINTQPGVNSIYLNENDYIFYKNGENYTLLNYSGNNTNLVLPQDYQGNPYTLASYCFAGQSEIESIVFPECITTLPIATCYQNTNLREVTIPEQIVSLGGYTFCQCYNLERVNFNAINITSSNNYEFQDCGKYSNGFDFYIGEKVQTLPANLFTSSSSAYSVYLKNLYFDSTYEDFFFGQNLSGSLATNMLSIHVPNIDRWLSARFANTAANPLSITGTKLSVNSELVTELATTTQTFVNNYAFSGYDYLTKVDLSSDLITYIGSYAFSDCPLQEIKIGPGVINIGDGAFNNNGAGLAYVEYAASNAANKSSAVFSNASAPITKLLIKNTVKRIPSYMFSSFQALKEIEFESDCRDIVFGTSAFYNSTSTTKVYIDSISNWLSFSFESSSANPIQNLTTTTLYVNGTPLTELIVPENITKINEFAFYRYSPLTSISLHSGVNEIGARALSFTPGLALITIPEESEYFTLIDGLLYSKNLTQLVCASKGLISEIVIPETVTTIPSGTFYSKTGLIEITLPNTLTTINYYAFGNCTGLKKCNLPKSLTTLGTYAFYNCTNLEELNYNAENLPSLGQDNWIFYKCGANKGMKVNFGKDVQSIPAYLFYVYNTTSNNYRPAFSSVAFDSDSVCTSIGAYAFWRNPSLKSFQCPDSLTAIYQYAFSDNTNLVEIVLSNNLNSIGTYAFSSCTSLKETTIPYSVKTIDAYAFTSCTAASFLCEALEQPSGWNSYWNPSNRPVVWGYNGQEYTYTFVTNCDIVIEPIISTSIIQLPSIVQENLYFWGWYLEEDFSGKQYWPGQKVYGRELTGVTFYARWEETSFEDGLTFETAYTMQLNTLYPVSLNATTQYMYFKFTPTATRTYYFQSYVSNTQYDTYGHLYNSSKTQLAASDDDAGNRQFKISYSLTAGTLYYFAARMYSTGSTGQFNVKIY